VRRGFTELVLGTEIQPRKHGLQNRPALGQGHSLPERAEISEQRGYLPRFGLRRWLQAL